MSKRTDAPGNRSVSVGGDATGNVVITGDRNKANLEYKQIALPPAHTVNMTQEVAKLRESLGGLKSDDSPKVTNALSDAESELKKPQPDKAEVGGAIERALKYAKQAAGYAELVEKLKPQIINAAAWLGSNWHSLLGYVGLSA